MEKQRIAVLFGGRSAEHEISVITGLQAIEAMDTERYAIRPVYIHPDGRWFSGDALLKRSFYRSMPKSLDSVGPIQLLPDPTVGGILIDGQIEPIDVYFLAFHGQYGEDGCVQGLLELANAAYTGCGPLASAIAMSKPACKALVSAHDIPVLPWVSLDRPKRGEGLEPLRKTILAKLGDRFPLFVKPSHLGSSVAVGVAHSVEELNPLLATVFLHDSEAIVEPCITNLLEANVAVIDIGEPKPSVIELPIASQELLSYEDKYMRQESKVGSGSQGMAELTRVIDPPDFSPQMKQQISDYACQAFKLLHCSGTVRFDFLIDTATDQIYFNELNPIPGSMAFYLWVQSDPPLLYTDLINRMIERAIARQQARLALRRDIGFKVL